MNVPNKLTVLRVLMVPFFIIAYEYGYFFTAFVLFIIASATDFLDGYLARKNNIVTNFGKVMDPLADKILVYSALVLMVQDDTIYSIFLIIILMREFTIAGMRTVAAAEGIVIAAAWSGKLKTIFQMIAVFILILSKGFIPDISYQIGEILEKTGTVLFYISMVLTVYSGFEYIYKNRNLFKKF